YPADPGGIFGNILADGLTLFFNTSGSRFIFITGLLCGITLVSGLSWLGVLDLIGMRIYRLILFLNKVPKSGALNMEPSFDIRPSRITDSHLRSTIFALPAAPAILLPPKPRERKIVSLDPSIKVLAGNLPPVSLLNE